MKTLLIFFLLLLPLPAFATFGAATAWDVQTTGANTNGGAFDSGVGSPGTNESLGSGTAVTITLTGTTTGTSSPAITSTTHGPGNFVFIASGSGCTLGWVEILSQSSGTATFDHAIGVSTDVCVGVLGGSLASMFAPLVATNGIATNNTVWIKSGTYTFTSTPTMAGAGNPQIFIGYGTAHGDGGTAPLITTATNGVVLISAQSAHSYVFQNMSFSNTAATRNIGISSGGTNSFLLTNCTMNGFSNAVNGNTNAVVLSVIDSLIENSTAAQIVNAASSNGTVTIVNSQIMSGSADGIDATPLVLNIEGSIIAKNAGKGVYVNNSSDVGVMLLNSDFSGNTGDGFTLATFNVNGNGFTSYSAQNNIFDDNGGYGTNLPAIPFTQPLNQYNAYYSNNSGGAQRNNLPAGTGDVIPTANPYVSSSTGNYALNSTAGGGAVLKGVGFPGAFPAGSTTGHLDIGAVQTAASTTVIANFGDSH